MSVGLILNLELGTLRYFEMAPQCFDFFKPVVYPARSGC